MRLARPAWTQHKTTQYRVPALVPHHSQDDRGARPSRRDLAGRMVDSNSPGFPMWDKILSFPAKLPILSLLFTHCGEFQPEKATFCLTDENDREGGEVGG